MIEQQQTALPRWPTPRYVARIFGRYAAVAAGSFLAALAALSLAAWVIHG